MKPRPTKLRIAREPDDHAARLDFDIASYPSDLTLSGISDMWAAGDIVIPLYQRRFVWTEKQASMLIESFLAGLPVPQVFFYIDSDNRFEVIDGHQRIQSIVFYLDGFFGHEDITGKKKVFRLKGLHPESPFLNKRFSELESSHQRKLQNSILRAINIRQLRPEGQATSAFHIFERLNTGGTPLRPQEIRNCVFRGKIVDELQALNGDPAWRRVLGKPLPDKHQKDVELILRIFAITMMFSEYAKPMKEFLNRAMRAHQEASTSEFKSFHAGFLRAVARVDELLPEKPFHLRGPLNASVLDAVMSVLIQSPKQIPDDLAKRFDKLKADHHFELATKYSTSDLAVMESRIKVTRETLYETP